MPTAFTRLDSPLGRLLLTSDGAAVTGLYLHDRPTAGWEPDARPFERVAAELEGYFAGRRTAFTVPLAPAGTPFQQAAWKALLQIPYGETVSYAEQARRLGVPTAARAVGSANGKNPICVLIPCHRVIATGGGLGGYGGGLDRKRLLLELEARGRILPPCPAC
jgi:methylated-DNA-[protein]-cysteine S-methyltransferase